MLCLDGGTVRRTVHRTVRDLKVSVVTSDDESVEVFPIAHRPSNTTCIGLQNGVFIRADSPTRRASVRLSEFLGVQCFGHRFVVFLTV